MQYKDLKSGMVFRNDQPPEYYVIMIQNNKVWSYCFYDDVIRIHPLSKFHWEDYFEDESDEMLIHLTDVKESVLYYLVKQLFENSIKREDI